MAKQDKSKLRNLESGLPKEPMMKLEASELETLRKSFDKLRDVRHELAFKTLEKEEQVRQINVDYDLFYSKAEEELRFIEKQQRHTVLELHQKYGDDVQFDLGTGEIKKQPKIE
jgi:tetrahydromethanopterin S-methyltransferase subunit G